MHIRMRTLTALLLSDGRPGHYHLSEGVIAAAQRLQPVSVLRLSSVGGGRGACWRHSRMRTFLRIGCYE